MPSDSEPEWAVMKDVILLVLAIRSNLAVL